MTLPKFDKKTIIISIICLLLIGLALYFFVFRKTETQNSISNIQSGGSVSDSENPGSGSGTTTYTKYSNDDYPLKLNSGGNRVKALQAGLNASYSLHLDIDGKFGTKTKDACEDYLGTAIVAKSDLNQLSIPTLYRVYI